MSTMRKLFLLISVITIVTGCASPRMVKVPDVSGVITRENTADWAMVVSQGKYRILNNVWNRNAASGNG